MALIYMEGSKHNACLICNSNILSPLRGYEKHIMVRCKRCGFVFMERIPSIEELNKYYSAYSYGDNQYLSPLTIKSYNTLLDEFEPYRKTNRMLDVGCGMGWFLQEAKKRGWEVYGTEFSPLAVKLCSEKGIIMKEGVLNAKDFDASTFDIITSFEVIEHINDPNREMKEIVALMREGGLFYCTTPNFNSLLRYYLKSAYNVITYPEHLSYYTHSTLNSLAKKHQLKPIKFLSTGFSITRLNMSTGKTKERVISKESSDEQLRVSIDSKWYWGLAKNLLNTILTWTNTGLTLKGYYKK